MKIDVLHAVATEMRKKQNATRAAVRRCLKAHDDELKKSGDRLAASKAYHEAMPILDSLENVHAYIACIARGMDMYIITGYGANKGLYTAQLALSALGAAKGKRAA